MISIVLEFFSFLSTNLVQTTSIVKKISIYFLIIGVVSLFYTQRKRMNAKFLFFSGIRLFNKIISAVFRRIC